MSVLQASSGILRLGKPKRFAINIDEIGSIVFQFIRNLLMLKESELMGLSLSSKRHSSAAARI